MKKLLLSLFSLVTLLSLQAQTNTTNLVVFSEDGDKFYLVINGIRQNIKSETNIRVTDLTTENFSFTIIFEDTKIPSIKKNQALPFGNEYTYRIKSDKKGKKSLKYFGETALTQPSSGTGATSIVYHTTEEKVVPVSTQSSGTNVSSTNSTGGNNSANSNIKVSESTTSTNSTSGNPTGVGMNVDVKDQGNGGSVSVGVNAGEVGMNIDIKVSENGASINVGGTGLDPNMNTTSTGTGSNVSTSENYSSTSATNNGTTSTYTTTTTTKTTTTTTTSGGNGNSLSTGVNNDGTGTSSSGTSSSGSGSKYTGTSNYGCSYPMSASDFATAKNSIDSEDFEDSKFSAAKKELKSNCLSTSQIKEIMHLFDFEATRLDFAKYAYDYCYDKNNYYQLNDAFDFESSVDELNEYIGKK